MKRLFIVIAIFLSFKANAQTADCPLPSYFSTLSSLLNKQVPEVLLSLSGTELKYKECFEGKQKEFLINFDDGKQQFTFVFINNIAKLIVVSGNQCQCLSELSHISKYWKHQKEKPTYYTNAANSAELKIIIDDDGGCMTIKALQ